jgi:hypothetical protein
MAQLPLIKKILREDLKNAPDWIDQLLYPINTFMEGVYYALDKELSFGDNINAAVRTLNFTTRSDYTTASPLTDGFVEQKLANPIKGTPKGVIVCKTVNADTYGIVTGAVTCYWEYLNGEIRVRYITGLANSTKYSINVYIF